MVEEETVFQLVEIDINVLVMAIVLMGTDFLHFCFRKVQLGNIVRKLNLGSLAQLLKHASHLRGGVKLEQTMDSGQPCEIQNFGGGCGDCWKVKSMFKEQICNASLGYSNCILLGSWVAFCSPPPDMGGEM